MTKRLRAAGVRLKPEHELLLICARTRDVEARAERARALVREGIDWAALLTAALDHGVTPLLYRNLFILGPEAVPGPFAGNLHALAMANTYRNLSLTAELLRVVALLEERGVPALAYKGPTLAAVAYGDTGLRQFSDLDLLVARQDIDRVESILSSAGFAPSVALTARQRRSFLAHTCELGYGLTDPRVFLDVHWRFAAAFFGTGPDPAAALERRRHVMVGGRNVPTLATEDALLVLCLNGAFHMWWRLSLICDVAELIQSYDGWDWQGLLGRARDLGMLRMVLLGLALAGEWLSAPVPVDVMAVAAGDRPVSALRARLRQTLFAGRVAWPSLLGEIAFQVGTLGGSRARLSYLATRAALPTIQDWQWVPLPDVLYPLYCLVRPVRLCFTGAVKPLLRRAGVLRNPAQA